MTTGLILQELLQGFSRPRDRTQIIERFCALPLLAPDRQDYIDAAELRNRCRRAGVLFKHRRPYVPATLEIGSIERVDFHRRTLGLPEEELRCSAVLDGPQWQAVA